MHFVKRRCLGSSRRVCNRLSEAVSGCAGTFIDTAYALGFPMRQQADAVDALHAILKVANIPKHRSMRLLVEFRCFFLFIRIMRGQPHIVWSEPSGQMTGWTTLVSQRATCARLAASLESIQAGDKFDISLSSSVSACCLCADRTDEMSPVQGHSLGSMATTSCVPQLTTLGMASTGITLRVY